MSTQKKAVSTIEEIIECAVRWTSADADNPDTPSADWQAVIPVLKCAPAMRQDLEDGVGAAQRVIDNWERGDLAGAVNDLQGWLETAKETLAKAAGEPVATSAAA